MNKSESSNILKWVLVTVALLCVAAAVLAPPAWFGAWGQTKVLGFLLRLRFVAAMVTLGAICLLELGVRRLLRAGEPVIGQTIFGWVVDGLLVAIFFTVFALTALFAKTTSKTRDPGRREATRQSYWLAREHKPVTLDAMKKQ